MLFESISYRDNLPFEISFLNVAGESKHCHRELEIILVLRGVTHYQIYHTDYELNTGDLIIADAEDLHQIHDSSEDILMLSMHIDTGRFNDIYPDIRYMFFVCEECMEGPSGNRQFLRSKLMLLKEQIASLALHYVKGTSSHAVLEDGINKLVAILVEHFQGFYMEDFQYKTSSQNMSEEDLQRLCRITRYIMLNYKERISLDDISQLEHLSSYYLSHLIKENLGFNFQNFVNAIRLEFAEKLLVFSNMTLMQISQECGFSSPNYFNKCFSAWHGKTPSQYRKDYVPCDRTVIGSFTQEEACELLSGYIINADSGNAPPGTVPLFPAQYADLGSLPWSEQFEPVAGPSVVLDSMEAVIKYESLSEELASLGSVTAVIDPELLKRNRDLDISMLPADVRIPDTLPASAAAGCTAEAYRELFVNKNTLISLWGGPHSLFSGDNMPSPVLQIYRYFSELTSPEAAVCDNMLILRCAEMKALIVFNTYTDNNISITIPADRLPASCSITCREISDHSCPDTVTISSSETGGNCSRNLSSRLLTKRAVQCREGRVSFIDAAHGIDYLLHPMDTVIFEFFCS